MKPRAHTHIHTAVETILNLLLTIFISKWFFIFLLFFPPQTTIIIKIDCKPNAWRSLMMDSSNTKVFYYFQRILLTHTNCYYLDDVCFFYAFPLRILYYAHAIRRDDWPTNRLPKCKIHHWLCTRQKDILIHSLLVHSCIHIPSKITATRIWSSFVSGYIGFYINKLKWFY